MATVKKPTLRDLAVKAGLAKANDLKVFQMDVDSLYTLLEGKFAGVRELDEDGVLELISDLKKGGDGGKTEERGGRRGREPEKKEEKPDGRRGRRAKVEEPEEEPEEEEEVEKEEEPEETPKRGRGRRGAAADDLKKDKDEAPRRGRGRPRREEAAEEPVKDKGGSKKDMDTDDVITLVSSLVDSFKVLTDKVDALDAKIDALATDTGKSLSGIARDLEEVHVGVESLYLDDIDKKDESLKDVLDRVRD